MEAIVSLVSHLITFYFNYKYTPHEKWANTRSKCWFGNALNCFGCSIENALIGAKSTKRHTVSLRVCVSIFYDFGFSFFDSAINNWRNEVYIYSIYKRLNTAEWKFREYRDLHKHGRDLNWSKVFSKLKLVLWIKHTVTNTIASVRAHTYTQMAESVNLSRPYVSLSISMNRTVENRIRFLIDAFQLQHCLFNTRYDVYGIWKCERER